MKPKVFIIICALLFSGIMSFLYIYSQNKKPLTSINSKNLETKKTGVVNKPIVKKEVVKIKPVPLAYKELIRDIVVQAQLLHVSIDKFMSSQNYAKMIKMLEKSKKKHSVLEKELRLEAKNEIIELKPYFEKYCKFIKTIDSSGFEEKHQLSIKLCEALKKFIDAECQMVLDEVTLSSSLQEKHETLQKGSDFAIKKIELHNDFSNPYFTDLKQIEKNHKTSQQKQLLNLYFERWTKAIIK